MWKRKHPEHPLSAMLPDFEKSSATGKRLWNQSDAWRVDEFRKSLPKGRNGILGDVTQRTWRKKQKEALKIIRRNERARLAMRKKRAKERQDEAERIEREREQQRINERLELAGAGVHTDQETSR